MAAVLQRFPIAWVTAVLHAVTNVGDTALWNFILEFKPQQE